MKRPTVFDQKLIDLAKAKWVGKTVKSTYQRDGAVYVVEDIFWNDYPSHTYLAACHHVENVDYTVNWALSSLRHAEYTYPMFPPYYNQE